MPKRKDILPLLLLAVGAWMLITVWIGYAKCPFMTSPQILTSIPRFFVLDFDCPPTMIEQYKMEHP